MHCYFYSFAFVILLISTSSPMLANVLLKPSGQQPDKVINVTINPPEEFNFLTKAEILRRREKYVQQSHVLLVDKYKADAAVFQNIEDNKPWWGLHGAFVWGQGLRSIEGPSEESRFVLNPLLLVGVNSSSALIWEKDKIEDGNLKDADFPFCWSPTALSFYPTMSLAQVVYSVSNFNEQLKTRAAKLLFNPDIVKLGRFGLVAYNARDFGFQYMYVDLNKSIDIVNTNGCSNPVLIKQLIHCGNSSKYPGGCNNMSPAMPEIDHLAITNLPARACVYFWKNQPRAVIDKPDFTFYIDFR